MTLAEVGLHQETAAPEANKAYRRQLPSWLAWVLARFPHFRRLPHPLLTHFVIVYLLAATFFSVLYLLVGDPYLDDSAFYCLGAGVLFLPPTILTGLFTHWLNFPGELHRTAAIEKRLSAILASVAAAAFIWRWLDPAVLRQLAGLNIIYLLLVLALAPLVTAVSYFGGMVTFPLEAEGPVRQAPPGARAGRP